MKLTFPVFMTLCFLALLCCSCSGQQTPVIEIREEGYEPFLLGPIREESLNVEPYATWFTAAREAYTPEPETIEALRKQGADTEYILFLGTWCEDSQREVPGLLSTLEAMGVGREHLRVFAVDEREDRYKTTPGGEEKQYAVDLVPTLIVFRSGQELGRIVEYTLRSPEADLLKILQ